MWVSWFGIEDHRGLVLGGAPLSLTLSPLSRGERETQPLFDDSRFSYAELNSRITVVVMERLEMARMVGFVTGFSFLRYDFYGEDVGGVGLNHEGGAFFLRGNWAFGDPVVLIETAFDAFEGCGAGE